jgi:hypothetical protein
MGRVVPDATRSHPAAMQENSPRKTCLGDKAHDGLLR